MPINTFVYHFGELHEHRCGAEKESGLGHAIHQTEEMSGHIIVLDTREM